MKTTNLIKRSVRRSTQRAFTLVELMLVLVILATLAAIVLPKFTGTTERARIAATQSQIVNLKSALDRFELDCGYYPRALEDVIVQPRDVTGWRGPYMDGVAVPLDAWKQPFVYYYPGKVNVNGFDLLSVGPDGQEGNEDDITSWGLNATAK